MDCLIGLRRDGGYDAKYRWRCVYEKGQVSFLIHGKGVIVESANNSRMGDWSSDSPRVSR